MLVWINRGEFCFAANCASESAFVSIRLRRCYAPRALTKCRPTMNLIEFRYFPSGFSCFPGEYSDAMLLAWPFKAENRAEPKDYSTCWSYSLLTKRSRSSEDQAKGNIRHRRLRAADVRILNLRGAARVFPHHRRARHVRYPSHEKSRKYVPPDCS